MPKRSVMPLCVQLALLLSLPLASQNTAKYYYDAAGRLTRVDYGTSGIIVYGYDQAGNLVSRQTLPAGSIQGALAVMSKSVSPGNSVAIPVTLSLDTNQTANKVAFTVQIAPMATAPALTTALSFTADPTLPPPSSVVNSPIGTIAITWLGLTISLSGTTHLGDVVMSMPIAAAIGQSYGVQITNATSALQSTAVGIVTTGGTVSVMQDYLAGDGFPSTGPSLGQFGDSALNTLDLIAALRAVTNITAPPVCSDLFDAMDTFPLDTSTTRGGDGVINNLDLIETLKRVTNIDTSRPRRTSQGRTCLTSKVQAARKKLDAQPIEAAIEIEDGAVYLHAYRDLHLAGLAFSIAASDGSAVFWKPDGDIAPSISDAEIPGAVALAWLSDMRMRDNTRTLLGHATSSAEIKINGASANEGNSGRDIRIALPGPSR